MNSFIRVIGTLQGAGWIKSRLLRKLLGTSLAFFMIKGLIWTGILLSVWLINQAPGW